MTRKYKGELTTAEIEYMARYYPGEYTSQIATALGWKMNKVYRVAKKLNLKKTDEFIEKTNKERNENLVKSGQKSRFYSGHTPANTGKKMEEFATPETIAKFRANCFRKGNVPKNTKHDGYVSWRKDASGNHYYFIRVSLHNMVHLHRYVWEKQHGPIPEGMVVVFKNYDHKDVRIENLELISRAENMLRNSINNYPEDLKKTLRTISKLKRTIEDYEKQ